MKRHEIKATNNILRDNESRNSGIVMVYGNILNVYISLPEHVVAFLVTSKLNVPGTIAHK